MRRRATLLVLSWELYSVSFCSMCDPVANEPTGPTVQGLLVVYNMCNTSVTTGLCGNFQPFGPKPWRDDVAWRAGSDSDSGWAEFWRESRTFFRCWVSLAWCQSPYVDPTAVHRWEVGRSCFWSKQLICSDCYVGSNLAAALRKIFVLFCLVITDLKGCVLRVRCTAFPFVVLGWVLLSPLLFFVGYCFAFVAFPKHFEMGFQQIYTNYQHCFGCWLWKINRHRPWTFWISWLQLRQGGHFQMFQLIVHSSLQTAEETRHEALLATLEVHELVGGFEMWINVVDGHISHRFWFQEEWRWSHFWL